MSASTTTPPALPDIPTEPTVLLNELRGIDWLQLLETWGLKLLAAAVIFLVGMWLAKRLSTGLERVLVRTQADTTLGGFLRRVSYAAMMVLVIITVLTSLGVNPTSMLAVLGAAGLAVGLALKDSLSNIASGVMLIVLRPFREGDFVQAAGLEGVIEEVRIFQTRMRTLDNRLIVLPNSLITTAPIINFTAKPQRRIDILVGVGYDDDLKQAKQVLLDIAHANAMVLKDPEPFVFVSKLGESSVDLTLYAWAKTKDFGQARSDLTEAVRTEIIGNGLNIPYPQRDLHVYHHNADGTPLTDIITKGVVDDGDVAKPAL
ncbi:small-conductance mechanosensitive channel [Pseudoxanthomonas sp. 3HH-4]|uniref:mechanosensitive ion channel family protein n=1 Tax=Pseudoxanthomonas sp. 3HH-4 TaxID=1690214 RepID=UPI00116DF7BC|nr:mechanosensitive ion channel domain-containing protein [Pseudoxanthomonas sp. 3HH-4]TQM12186.1 small-conductance mechanosensitive channel [Pseudoxanthomonas sp. 3HH-4]